MDRETRREYLREWRKNNPDRVAEYNRRARETPTDRHRRRLYGLERGEWNAILEFQGGVCGVCGTDKPGGTGGWCCDHAHRTGAIRGALCYSCNRRIAPVLEWLHDQGLYTHPYLRWNWTHQQDAWLANRC